MNLILAFLFLVLIGYVASHLSLFQSRVSLGFRFLFTAGTEFLIVGWILGPWMVGLVSLDQVMQLSPILSLVLGWIGLLMGLQFSGDTFSRISRRVWGIALLYFVLSFSTIALFFYLVTPVLFTAIGDIGILGGQMMDRNPIPFVGFVVLLGALGCLTTSSALGLLIRDHNLRGDRIRQIQMISEIRSPLAILVMGVWYALMHVSSNPTTIRELAGGLLMEDRYAILIDGVVLNPLGWLLVSVLLGVGLGWLLHYLTSKRLKESEMLLLLAGMVIFSGGLSSYLHLSPLFVNLVMGMTLANLPNFSRTRMTNLLLNTEKPFFVIFMLIAGTLWPPISMAALVMAGLFIVLRFVVFLLCGWVHQAVIVSERENQHPLFGLTMLPMGGLSVALVIDCWLIRPGFFSELALGIAILVVLVNQILGPPVLASILLDTTPNRKEPRPADTPVEPEGAA